MLSRMKAKGAFVSEDAPSYLDGGKPNSVVDDHLSRPSRGGVADVWRIFIRHDATIPEDQTDRLSSLCFVLHRMGFFVPRELLREL